MTIPTKKQINNLHKRGIGGGVCKYGGICFPEKYQITNIISEWEQIRTSGNKKVIDFDKIAKEYTPRQIETIMKENKYTRECALLYLWFYNNVSVYWLKDVKQDFGRGMYRKFAEKISSLLIEDIQ